MAVSNAIPCGNHQFSRLRCRPLHIPLLNWRREGDLNPYHARERGPRFSKPAQYHSAIPPSRLLGSRELDDEDDVANMVVSKMVAQVRVERTTSWL